MLGYLKKRWNNWKLEKQRRAEEADKAIWRVYYTSRSIDEVAQMTGTQFEEFLARLFECMGYTDVRTTPPNDQGADVICLSPFGAPTVIQAKRWSGPVGNSAVQELLGAMRHYGCEEGIVVTNSRFTPAAKSLVAGGSDVTLCDKQWLDEKMREFLPASVPEFRRDTFDEIMEGWIQMTRKFASGRTTRRTRFPNGHTTFTEVLRYAAEGKGKELTVVEIKKLAHLHINSSEAEANYREVNRKLEEARARQRHLEEELADLDEALSPHWSDKYDDR